MEKTNPEILGFKLRQGWKLNKEAGNARLLLVQKLMQDSCSFPWYLSKGKGFVPLLSTPALQQRMGASIVAGKKRQLIYWREQGIAEYDFTAKKEKLLVALDSNLFRAAKFYLDESEDVLYFIREKYSPPWNAILNVLKKTGKSPDFEVKYSLWVYSFKDNTCRSIANFHESGSSFLADTRADLFYRWSKRKIIIADLHSGKVKKTIPEQDIVKLALLPSGRILVWGFHTPGAYQIDAAGRRETSAFKGMFPAYSPDGNHCAFWERTGKLYLSGVVGKPECLLTLSNFGKDSWTGLQPPAWSSCGRYLALLLDTPNTSGRPKTTLFVLDLKSKTASIRARNVLDFNWL